MKYALQIYGTFRTFEKCLPNILTYINYDQHDYDVFILSQRNDSGYSIENEQKIKLIFKDKVVVFKYIEDYPSSSSDLETSYFTKYGEAVGEGYAKFGQYVCNNLFVTRMWYRRFLLNELRKDYEKEHNITYEWVIRTRFDISFWPGSKPYILPLLSSPPKEKIIYMILDIISCGSPDVINYESMLIKEWPFIYKVYKETGSMPKEFMGAVYDTPEKQHTLICWWLFMSEANLHTYFHLSPYEPIILPSHLTINR